jgi:hypothetical protein
MYPNLSGLEPQIGRVLGNAAFLPTSIPKLKENLRQ